MSVESKRPNPTHLENRPSLARPNAAGEFQAALDALGASAVTIASTGACWASAINADHKEPPRASPGLLHHVQVFDNLEHWSDATRVNATEAAETMETLACSFQVLASNDYPIFRRLESVDDIEVRATAPEMQFSLKLRYAGTAVATHISFSLGELRSLMLDAGLIPTR